MANELERILRFLKELDEGITADVPLDLYLVGGGAITLAYDHENRTADLNFIDPPTDFEKRRGKDSPLALKHGIYVSSVYAINLTIPNDWRNRCQLLDIPMKRLRIFVASVEDIVLGKLARMEPKDLEDIFSLYDHHLLDPNKIIDRLRQNKKELQKPEYRNNVKLLFGEIFKLKIKFARGNIAIEFRMKKKES